MRGPEHGDALRAFRELRAAPRAGDGQWVRGGALGGWEQVGSGLFGRTRRRWGLAGGAAAPGEQRGEHRTGQ
uniref:hypothetical protein n=1 Tax=Arachnia propionica TaxID=1750 RepID=UPI0030C6F9C4